MNKRSAAGVVGALVILIAGVVPPAGAGEASVLDVEDSGSLIEPDSGSLTVEEGNAVAEELDATVEEWAAEAADDVVEILPFDGQVYVLADGNEEQLKQALPEDVSDSVEVVRGALAPAAAPNADRNDWGAGTWINGNPYICTAGFTFRRASGEVVGSTAKHCGGGTWTNNGRVVGKTSIRAPGADDVALIKSARGTTFTHDVWTRGANGRPVLRDVQDAGVNKVGDRVAHYGRTSGGGSGTITRITADGRVYADCATTRPGDSGGPVYVVLPSGRVEARGTLSGYVYVEKNGNNSFEDGIDEVIGMYYTDISRSMTDLGVNLVTKDTVGAVPANPEAAAAAALPLP